MTNDAEDAGEATLRQLAKVGLGSRTIAFIRHAEREAGTAQARDTPLDKTWQLTVRGRARARQFGHDLPPFRRFHLVHTSIPRTMDTVQEIARGIRTRSSNAPILFGGGVPALSLTRFYARNLDLRNELIDRLGRAAFLQAWLDGKLPADVLPPVREAVLDFVSSCRAWIDSGPESTLQIAVGHDYDLIVLREILFEGKLDRKTPVGFLEGVVMTETESPGLIAYWGDACRSIPTRG